MRLLLTTCLGLICLHGWRVEAEDPATSDASFLGGGGVHATNADYTLISSWRQQVQTSITVGGGYVNYSGFIGAFTEARPDLDSDGDGLTDVEEVTGNRFNPAQRTNPKNPDTDGDGTNDLVEAIAGTDPLNPASVFTVQAPAFSSLLTESFSATIPTQPGRRYRIMFTDLLSTPNPVWSLFLNTNEGVGVHNALGGSPSTFTFIDDFTINTSGSAPSNVSRAYRISISKP